MDLEDRQAHASPTASAADPFSSNSSSETLPLPSQSPMANSATDLIDCIPDSMDVVELSDSESAADSTDYVPDSMNIVDMVSQSASAAEIVRVVRAHSVHHPILESSLTIDDGVPPELVLNDPVGTEEDIAEEKQRALDANVTGNTEAFITASDLRWPDNHSDEIDSILVPSSQVPDETLLTARDKIAWTYMSALEVSKIKLAKLAVREENGLSTVFQSANPELERSLAIYTCLPILACINNAVLRHIICGNLALAYRKEPEVKQYLETRRERGNSQPAIYMQLFVAPNGLSPSPAELARLFQPVRSYCEIPKTDEQISEAVTIDRAFNPNSRWGIHTARKGKFKYLCDSVSSDSVISKNRIRNILCFVKNLERRLGKVFLCGKSKTSLAEHMVEPLRDTAAWTQPLDAPLVELGYAKSPTERLSSHRNHQSSNYIMNLWEAASKVVHGHGKFNMMQFVVFHVFEVPQAAAAEILLTR